MRSNAIMRAVACLTVTFTMCVLRAQTLEIDEIKNNDAYFWGVGIADTKAEATKRAQEEISTKITTFVSTSDKLYMTNEQKGMDASSTVSFESKMNSYSVTTLNNLGIKTVSDKRPYHVFAYIDTAEVNRMFSDREFTVREYVKIANEAYTDLNFEDALRYYYSSYLLAQSLRYRSSATVTDEEGTQQKAMPWIKKRIETIMSKVKVTLLGKNEGDTDTYRLGFLYDDKPVSRIGFTYFDGSGWEERPVMAADGQGLVTLRPGFDVSGLKVRIEYKYLAYAQNDRELTAVFGALSDDVNFGSYEGTNVTQANMKAEAKTDKGRDVAQASKSQTKALEEVAKVRTADKPLSASEAQKYADAMSAVIQNITSRNYSAVDNYCTADGAKAFNELVTYGNARVVGTPTITFSEYYGHIYARSVPMQFTFRNNRVTENVVFTFTKEGKIDDVTFGLGRVAQDNLFGNLADEKQAPVRSAINNFLESYKTAYALGRFDYLRDVFSDDALIITGKVVHRLEAQGGDSDKYRTNRLVTTTRQTKNEYLRKLEDAFRKKEYVNIKFANNTIRGNDKAISQGKDVYGIQIRQDYYSNNYSDQGYLFLMVDVSDPDRPIIHVRVWQEKPDQYMNVAGIEDF